MRRGWLFLAAVMACGAAPARAQLIDGRGVGIEVGGAREDPMSVYRLQLELNPVGTVVEKGLSLSNYLRLHPAGFRTDEFGIAFAPTYGFGNGWEASAGVIRGERRGPGGNALFYGAGIQKQLVGERGSLPSISLGGYGMFGPHDHLSGTFYLAATKKVYTGKNAMGIFLHGGAKFEGFDADDVRSSTGIRPQVGMTFAYNRRFFIGADFSPSQAWQPDDEFAVRATYLFARYKGYSLGVTGGVRSAGYNTVPFIGGAF